MSGLWFHSGCDDTSQNGGCSAPTPTEAPLDDVALVLRQGASTWTLDTQDAASGADRYAVTWHARLPAEAAPGPAVLRAGTASLPLDITS